MIKVFISQPMRNKTDKEIEKERDRAIIDIMRTVGEDIDVIQSFFKGADHEEKPLWYLGKSFELLSKADIAYFCTDWDKNRGCRMEHMAAELYGIEIIEAEIEK